jgi:signal transduction histidine kinase
MHFGQRLVALLTVGLAPVASLAGEPLPRSVLILDQSDAHSGWYTAFSSAFRSTLNAAASGAPISIYAEHLDLSRFRSAQQEDVLRTYLRDKFRQRPIGVVVAQGSSSLEFVVRSRAELWSGVPVVFAGVDEETAARLRFPSDITGTIYQLPFRNTVTAAQALVPNLKRIALVGDPWERQAVRHHYKDDIPVFAAQFEFIDLIGLPMAEIRKRVAALPEDTAIIYTSVTLDGAGATYIPHEGLAAFADVANRPIVIDAETNVGHGGTGGFVATPVPVGEAAARLALRIFAGESASQIPITRGDFTRPVFDWRQLQRFGISENRLPPGSEVRFRPLSMWEQYRWQMIAVALVLLFQAALITGLLVERHGRIAAEVESRRRLVELAHINRTAAVSAMSTSIAHELNQPLGSILSNAEAAELLLAANPLDMTQIKAILADIRQADERAGEIIASLRGLLKRKDIERQDTELREVIANVANLLEPEAKERNVEMSIDRVQPALFVRADLVHLQQVLLNLALNAMDAMRDSVAGKRTIAFETALVGTSTVEVAVADTGTGIPKDKLKDVFEPFFTTKPHGTGLGLSIVRTIVESYGGRIWADNKAKGGAIFRFTLPLAKARPA